MCALVCQHIHPYLCVWRGLCQGGGVRLCAGVYLGGDGREILIDPLISGLRGATELQNTWEKSGAECNKAKQEWKKKDNRWRNDKRLKDFGQQTMDMQKNKQKNKSVQGSDTDRANRHNKRPRLDYGVVCLYLSSCKSLSQVRGCSGGKRSFVR